jgi:hypothetical protein
MSKVQCLLVTTNMESARLDRLLIVIVDLATQDTNYQMIIDELRLGTKQRALPRDHPGHTMSATWSNLSLLDNEPAALVIQNAHRIYFPVAARKNILRCLHVGHNGTTKMRAEAALHYAWPRKANEIGVLSSQCIRYLEFPPDQLSRF